MHPCANAVEIPTNRIEQAFMDAAVPGFTGKLVVHIRVDEAAAEHVEFTIERTINHRLDELNVPTAKDLGFKAEVDQVEFDTRRQTVHIGIAEKVKPRFTLGTPIKSVTGHFKDGMLRAIDVQDVQ